MAFYLCDKLTAVSIPNSVANIGYGAFRSCSSLKEIIIPENITTIEELTLGGCSKLSKVILPKSLTEIKSDAFTGCDLKEVICYSHIPPKCDANSFDREPSDRSPIHILLRVPAFTYYKYWSAPVWEDFEKILAEKGEILLNKTAATMVVGETLQLTATVFPSEATDDISWYSDGENIAQVSQTGLVTAISKGHANIIVYCGGEYGSICEIEVLENSGIEDVFPDKEEPIVVYNLQGLRLSITSTEHLSQLPAGIYLVNGQKYIVK